MARTRRILRYRTGPTRYQSARVYAERRGWVRWVGSMVVFSLMATAAGIPLVLAVGGLAREGTQVVESVPELVDPPLTQTSRLLTADGALLATVYTQNRVYVPLRSVPAVLLDAVLAVEDDRFYEHDGLDVIGIGRALVRTGSGTGRQGGSTITQQYVKNARVLAAADPEQAAEATEATLTRKLVEAHQALELEDRLSKDEILERYLNTVYFGSSAWGVEAASRTYFGVSVGELGLAQAALLAGLVRAPSTTNPYQDREAALARRQVVLDRMLATGRIDRGRWQEASAEAVVLGGGVPANGCAGSAWPFYCEWVLGELERQPVLGSTVQERRARLALGGLTITTALDPRVQAGAQVGADRLGRADPVAVGVAVVEPGTGAVRALAVNRDWGPQAPATMYPLLTETNAPGASLFKVFTLTAAVEAGAVPGTVLPGGSSHRSTVFDNPDAGAYTNSDGGGRAQVTLAEATAASQNTAFVQLLERVGVERAAEMARRLGASSVPLGVGSREGSFTLGSRSVSVLEMANVFATLAAGGIRCVPTPVVSVDAGAGPVGATPVCARAISAPVAYTVTAMLTGVVTDGTGRRAGIGRPVAGKTGTAEDFGAAWFAGYTPQLAAAVWLGDPRGPAYPLVDVAGTGRVFGGGLPAEVFASVMVPALEGLPVQEFPRGGPSVGGGPVLTDVRGMDVERARSELAGAWIPVEVELVDAPDWVQSSVVVATVPEPGRVVNGTVRLQVSR